VADSFTRTVSSGFGTADVGGAWSVTGTATRFAVASGVGTMSAAPGTTVRADLLGVQLTSTDVSSTISVNAAPSGGGVYVALVGRRVSSTTDYRLKVRLQAGGAVTAQLVRVSGGVETAVQTVTTVPGLTYAAGDELRLRLVVTGVGTTTLQAKVWKDGTAEPAAWLLQSTDTTAALQAAGSVGYWYYLSSSSTTNPTVLSVDDLTAGPAA
jgi:large repetitive protein